MKYGKKTEKKKDPPKTEFILSGNKINKKQRESKIFCIKKSNKPKNK